MTETVFCVNEMSEAVIFMGTLSYNAEREKSALNSWFTYNASNKLPID